MDAAASAVVKQTEREKGATDGNASVIEGAPPIPARRSPLCHSWTQAAGSDRARLGRLRRAVLDDVEKILTQKQRCVPSAPSSPPAAPLRLATARRR